MAGWRRAVDLAMTAEEIETLTALSRSRTEAARHVERAQMLLAYRQQRSFFAVGQRLGVHHQELCGRLGDEIDQRRGAHASRGGEPEWLAGGGTKMKHPVVSRRGSLIAYENWLYDVNLWVTGASDRALTSASDEWEFDPDMSPDGTRVAFVSTRSGEFEIWSVATSGGEPRRITSLAGPRARQPRWSPDGTRLLFIEDAPGKSSVVTIGRDGSRERSVVSEVSGAGIASASWSHDGKSILFGSRRGGAWRLWRVARDGGTPSPIAAEGARTGFEASDGSEIYFCRADRPGLFRLSVAAGTVDAVVPDFDAGQFANWRVSREAIYFVRPRGDAAPELMRQMFGSRDPVRVSDLASQAWDGFSISSDGRIIVYGRTIHHSCDLKIIENAY